jgi:hypothetical protein
MEALLSGQPLGPTPEQVKQRRHTLAGVAVLTLVMLAVIGVLISRIADNDRPSVVAKTGESSVVRTIEENGKPILNAAIKKTR